MPEADGHKRREFLAALGGALGVVLAADSEAAAARLEALGKSPASKLPSGFVFHRLFTEGDDTRGLDDIEEVLPGVMISDRSEIIFHARLKNGNTAVFRMRIGRGRRPGIARLSKIVEKGDRLADGTLVDKIGAGDINSRGTYVTTIRNRKGGTGVYIDGGGRGLRPFIKPGDRIPGGKGRFQGQFGDVDIDDRDDIIVVGRWSEPGAIRQGMFLFPNATKSRGRALIKSGQVLAGSKIEVVALGLVERNGNSFVAQVFGRVHGRTVSKKKAYEPSAIISGDIRRGRRGLRVLSANDKLRPPDSAVKGQAFIGPRVSRSGLCTTVVHEKGDHLHLHRHRRGRTRSVAETGQRSASGQRIQTISAPIFSDSELYYYRTISRTSMELLVVHDGQRRVVLQTGDRVGGRRVKGFTAGWHTDQVDSRGRIAFQATLMDGRTAIVIGTPL